MELRLHSELASDLSNILARYVQYWDSGGLHRRAVTEGVLQVSTSVWRGHF